MPIPQDHLLWSYRLAKFEVVAERRGIGRIGLARFEQNLAENLRKITSHGTTAERLFRSADIGRIWVRPKSATPHSRPQDIPLISIPEQPHDHTIDKINVRILLEPSPEFIINEAIWLRAFGPALDALLNSACLANRLNLTGTPPQIPTHGRRIYKYWVPAYRLFRQTALLEARRILELEKGACTLTTLDLASYFDLIDPSFLITDSFIQKIEENSNYRKIPFDPTEYKNATQGYLEALTRFRAKVKKTIGRAPTTGIPIGSLTARLIANVALCELDEFITSRPDVTYYGRYVDDILIVQRKNPEQPQKNPIPSLLPINQHHSSKAEHLLDTDILKRPGSTFKIQSKKLRIFNLKGPEGIEYLGAVEHELEQVSSERRRFLDPQSHQIQHIVSASPGAEPIRALREADALSLRKLALSSVCEKVTTAAIMLSRDEARKFSRSHLGKIGRMATDWSRWAELLDQSIRILAATLIAGDTETANEVLDSLLTRTASLTNSPTSPRIQWGAHATPSKRARTRLQQWIKELLFETICTSAPFNDNEPICREITAFDGKFDLEGKLIFRDFVSLNATLLSSSDLRWVDRESDHSIGCALQKRPTDSITPLEQDAALSIQTFERAIGLEAFRKVCAETNDPIYSNLSNIELMLLSRPPSYADILIRWLRAKRELKDLIHTINAVRGTRYTHHPITESDNGLSILAIPGTLTSSKPQGTQIILGNLCTEEEWWTASLTNPVLTIERQRRLSRVINQAIDAAGRARRQDISTLFILPELSLPRRWLREVLRHISRSEPSLSIVAGLEYDIVGNKVFNEAIAFLPRQYMSAAGWVWTKRRPAYREAIGIKKKQLEFSTRTAERRFSVLHSEHGRLIPLICSELLEVDARSQLLGRIDLLLVPAWNQDNTSFEHLIHSTALELHCFVGVANNGLFSDCRVRGPFSETWRREAARLIARGENETLVTNIQTDLLKIFHENQEFYRTNMQQRGWPAWKPLPPGMDESTPISNFEQAAAPAGNESSRPSKTPSPNHGPKSDKTRMNLK
ncbi:reverse transcriptase domain-containing protein [Myxococcus xanthus]|uniref:reverse transcriptase domain-containing protein n=1 Tax=Myxococcus xanthus TaxID=34 RepID=UPI00112A1617|nr:reverse transcriptase domain-containing protein [Myxococcus xanthus]